jgi:acetyl esterase/lipase
MLRLTLLIMTLLTALAAGTAQNTSTQPVLRLWPNGAPGAQKATEQEHDTTTAQDQLIAGRPVIRLGNVSTPTLTFYPAPAEKNSGATVLVAPGGGYRILAYDLEGTEVCTWLNSIGVNCGLLKYRVPTTEEAVRYAAPLQDAQRAMALLRSHAAEWHLDGKRIGVLGFSAGGHLAALLSTHGEEKIYPTVDAADQQPVRPDFALLIYPAYLTSENQVQKLAPEFQITSAVPPTFLLQAEDDPIDVDNSLTYFAALKAANVAAELHIYAQGGHGYGLRPTQLPITHWPQLAETWLHSIGVLGK